MRYAPVAQCCSDEAGGSGAGMDDARLPSRGTPAGMPLRARDMAVGKPSGYGCTAT